MRKVFFISVVVFLFLNETFGQVLSQGQGWLRLSEQIISSDQFFNAEPNSVEENIRTNSYYITSLTGEYAISNRLTAVAAVPFFVRVTINELKFNQSGNVVSGGALNSIGDTDIGVRYLFRRKLPIQVMAFVSLGLPFGVRGDVSSDANLQTGDGEFNQMVGLQLGQSFSRFNFFGSVAFNNRSDGYSNEIRYNLEAQYSSNRWKAKLRYTGIESLFNDTALVSQNGIFSNHRELISPGVELSYNYSKKIGIFASGDFAVAGRNTLSGTMWGFGVQVSRLGE